jgi:uncharacterized protein YfaS (alpha-2-macroglobulin family)
MTKTSRITKQGTVQKIIKSPLSQEPEKAQINIDGADMLYREIRIENAFQDEKGKRVKLKAGAHVDVTVEADLEDTVPEDTE